MRKRGICLLFVCVLLLTLLPTAQASETNAVRQTIADQYDAYAASLYQADAADKAIDKLLDHSLNGKGKHLTLGETDAVTSCLLQTALFRAFFVDAMEAAAEVIRSQQPEYLMIGSMTMGWHDFALDYGVRQFEYDETDSLDDDISVGTLVPYTVYTGASNENDNAFILVVGGARCRIRLHRTSVTETQVTYHADIYFEDSFSFDSDYSNQIQQGYDTSFSELLGTLGSFLLKEYDWHIDMSLDLTLPNACTHETASYRWEFSNGQFVNVTGEGLEENRATRQQPQKPDGTLYNPYFQTEKTVNLSHELPWVVEFRMMGKKLFMLSETTSISTSSPDRPYFMKAPGYISGGEFTSETNINGDTGEEEKINTRMEYGCGYSNAGFNGEDMHTYRLENRLQPDGSNMVYLLVDGVEIGPMTRQYVFINNISAGSTETSDWFNGKDFKINYLFNRTAGYTEELTFEYIQIWENGQNSEPHSYFETTITAATCTEPGKRVHTCSHCGASYSEIIAEPLGHAEEVVLGKAATCEETGLTDGSQCTTCGQVVTPQQTIPALGHSWDAGTVTKAATCTEAGEILYTCTTDSSHTKTEVIPIQPHSPVTDTAIPATCTTAGLTEGIHCADCGTVLTAQEVIPATGHSWNSGEITAKPTSESAGAREYTCTTCGETRVEEIPYEAPVRIAGENRFETAFLVADAMKEELGVEMFDTVIIASGTNFADALSGSYLASVKNAPILLSYTTETINDQVKSYIHANLSEGGTVYILGGEAAVPKAMEAGLEGFTVKRLAGNDRFGTNLAILSEAGVGGKDILVCTGLDFADSLSASAAGLPILLVYNELTDVQRFFLSSVSHGDFYIIGGENAVSTVLEDQLATYGATNRIGGANRFETSVRIAETFFASPESAALAYAWNYPDGLCGGALAAAMDAPLILTMTNYEAPAAGYVQTNPIRKATVLGGETLISENAVRTIFAPADCNS